MHIKPLKEARTLFMEIKEWVWIFSIISFVLGSFALGIAAYIVLPTVGIATNTTERPRIMAPASPGLTTAEDICKFGDVSYGSDRLGGNKYVATFGLDVLEWPEAVHKIGLVNGQPVILSDEVIKCLKLKQ